MVQFQGYQGYFFFVSASSQKRFPLFLPFFQKITYIPPTSVSEDWFLSINKGRFHRLHRVPTSNRWLQEETVGSVEPFEVAMLAWELKDVGPKEFMEAGRMRGWGLLF